jgi:hypothetical protein
MTSPRIFLAALLLACASPAFDAHATQVRHLDTRALALESNDIVVGRVAATRSYWNDAHTKILTDVSVEVTESVKGAGPGTLTLTQLGGEVDGVRYTIPGCPAFRPGEETLLFLWRDPRGRAQVNGLAQGKFEIMRDAVTGARTVQRAMPGLAVQDARSLKLVAPTETAPKIPLDDLLNEVRRTIEEAGR